FFFYFFFQEEDGIRDFHVTGVQTCALPICRSGRRRPGRNGCIQQAPPPAAIVWWRDALHTFRRTTPNPDFPLGRLRHEVPAGNEIGRASCRETGYKPSVADRFCRQT